MICQIRNECLTASVHPLGAELQSLKSVATGEEYLWQGNPDVWSGQAPILFPIVGALKNNTMRFGEQDFHLPRHGLARKAVFRLIGNTQSECEFSLRSSSATLSSFPWKFELRVRFAVTDNTLAIDYQVMNQDTTDMIFTLGSHPAFALANAVSDYSVRFSDTETLDRFNLDDEGLLAVDGVRFMDQSGTIELNDHLFDDDALVFKNIKSNEISLFHDKKRHLTVNTGTAPHLGIWAKPAAHFVCIEPWFGYSDSQDSNGKFDEKSSMMQLEPENTFRHQLAISIADST